MSEETETGKSDKGIIIGVAVASVAVAAIAVAAIGVVVHRRRKRAQMITVGV